MSDVLLHPQTQQAIDHITKSGAHAILLIGGEGAGKFTLARAIAATLVGVDLETAPYVLSVEPAGKSVTIEQIREVQKFLQLKTTGTGNIRRIVIIHQADTMTVEAQNSLLKILEEPPEDTVLILTASRPHQLRPTIHSRVQSITILPPVKETVLNYFLNKGFNGTDIERAYMLSNGQIGLLTELLNNTEDNEIVKKISLAKRLYQLSAFERLAMVDELSKDKDGLATLLFACKRICTTALEQAALKNQHKNMQSWHQQLSLVVTAEESLKSNPNTKLLLTDLFISI